MYINNIKVDKYQEAAIKCNDNCLLIAGAGAGKTFTILGKINYLLENNIYKESEILVISFTNKSVMDLKMKISHNVDIFTFHKLAIQILKDYKIDFTICPTDTLKYITKEYFLSLKNKEQINELLLYFKEYTYSDFLKSTKFKMLIKTITTYISLFKTNNCVEEDLKTCFNLNPILTKYILIIMAIYKGELLSCNQMDFDDLIINSTNVLKSFYKYKFIIIDEFQDTSFLRWNLIDKLLKINNAKIFAVGDDFQSIYHFSGCKVDLLLNFKDIVPNSQVLKLKYTYRNSQELIDIAGKFILKNNKQINKKLISHKRINKPIKYINYINPKKSLEKLLKKLIKEYENILILGRNNSDIDNFITKNIRKENDYLVFHNKKINYLTVHSSKGLEADVVIIINLTDKIMGFPNKIQNINIIDKINSSTDNYLYAEERRLFYVALTRTKNEVYLLTPYLKKSMFVKEIRKTIF